MPKSLVISDLHLGVNRTGGTTQASLEALRAYGHQQHYSLLQLAVQHDCKRVIVNGDLCDSFSIPLNEAIELYVVADEFLRNNPDKELVYCTGNHDVSRDSSKMGTVAFVGMLLKMRFPKQFTLVDAPYRLDENIYILPHVSNQETFELALTKVPDGIQYLLIHANFDNAFAMQSDNSLNLTREKAKEFKARGIKMVFGHEHQGRELLGGHVIMVGNNFPTSVSDCLSHGDGQKDGTKRCLILNGESIEFIRTWGPDNAEGWFAEVDWRELKDVTEDGRGFIRVTGTACSAEAADAVKAISLFRQKAISFVITNAVQVERAEGLEGIADSIEDIRAVNVVGLLMDMLNAEERAVIEPLLEGAEA